MNLHVKTAFSFNDFRVSFHGASLLISLTLLTYFLDVANSFGRCLGMLVLMRSLQRIALIRFVYICAFSML